MVVVAGNRWGMATGGRGACGSVEEWEGEPIALLPAPKADKAAFHFSAGTYCTQLLDDKISKTEGHKNKTTPARESARRARTHPLKRRCWPGAEPGNSGAAEQSPHRQRFLFASLQQKISSAPTSRCRCRHIQPYQENKSPTGTPPTA